MYVGSSPGCWGLCWAVLLFCFCCWQSELSLRSLKGIWIVSIAECFLLCLYIRITWNVLKPRVQTYPSLTEYTFGVDFLIHLQCWVLTASHSHSHSGGEIVVTQASERRGYSHYGKQTNRRKVQGTNRPFKCMSATVYFFPKDPPTHSFSYSQQFIQTLVSTDGLTL